MKTEERYAVVISDVLGTLIDIDMPSFRSNDFEKLVNYLRRLYTNQYSASYKKNTPKILDRVTKREYFIFAS